MSLTIQNLEKQLSQNRVSPFYFIMGPERFLIKQAIGKIKNHLLSKELLDFNYEIFFANKMNINRLRESLQTLPVLSKKRIIICEQSHLLKADQLSALVSILKNPIDTSVLIFVSETPDKRKKTIKELMSVSTIISADTPKEAQWVEWLKWMGKKEGLVFSSESILLIREYACYSLINLETEVKKLKNFVGSKTHVSEQDVLDIVPRIRPENIFALSKAIGKKNLSNALICLANLLEDNQNEIGALSLISRHIRILVRIKHGLKKGDTQSTLCYKIGIPHFFIKDYIEESHLWTEQKLISSMEILKKTDKAIKFSSVSSHIWLEHFIIQSCVA